jgi:hypothetical protein
LQLKHFDVNEIMFFILLILLFTALSSFSLSSKMCVWCWHHIMEMAEKDGTEGRCPACRTPYDKEKIVGMATDCERLL